MSFPFYIVSAFFVGFPRISNLISNKFSRFPGKTGTHRFISINFKAVQSRKAVDPVTWLFRWRRMLISTAGKCIIHWSVVAQLMADNNFSRSSHRLWSSFTVSRSIFLFNSLLLIHHFSVGPRRDRWCKKGQEENFVIKFALGLVKSSRKGHFPSPPRPTFNCSRNLQTWIIRLSKQTDAKRSFLQFHITFVISF